MKARESKDRTKTKVPGTDYTKEPDTDAHLGATESDKPGQAGQGNRNVPALDSNGLPADRKKICEDVIGAHVDESTG